MLIVSIFGQSVAIVRTGESVVRDAVKQLAIAGAPASKRENPIGVQSLIDAHAFDLAQRGMSPSEIRERIGDFRIAVTFGRGFKIERRNELVSFADQSLTVDD